MSKPACSAPRSGCEGNRGSDGSRGRTRGPEWGRDSPWGWAAPGRAVSDIAWPGGLSLSCSITFAKVFLGLWWVCGCTCGEGRAPPYKVPPLVIPACAIAK